MSQQNVMCLSVMWIDMSEREWVHFLIFVSVGNPEPLTHNRTLPFPSYTTDLLW